MDVSARSLLLFLSIFGIVSSTLIAWGLTYYSGNSALDETKSNCDDGLSRCFESGSSNVLLIANDLMNTVGAEVNAAVGGFLGMQPYIVDLLVATMKAQGMGEGNATHDELMLNQTIRPLMHQITKWGASRGVTDVLVVTSSSYSDSMSFYIATDAVYARNVHTEPGTYILGSQLLGKSPMELQNDLINGNQVYLDHGLADETGLIIDAPCIPNNVTIPSKCRISGSTGRGILNWVNAFSNNPGVTSWGPIERKNELLGKAAYKALVTGKLNLFLTSSVSASCAIDVDRMSLFLQDSVKSLVNGSRIYLIERDSWSKTETSIMAVSHGRSWITANGSPDKIPTNYTNVPDPKIREHATFMANRIVESNNALSLYNLTLNGSTAIPNWVDAEGTTFWTQLQLITDETAGTEAELRLYAIIIVPKDTAMATITGATTQVKSYILEEEEKTDENLKQANYITAGVLTAAIVVLAVATGLFFNRITAPLKVLADDMHEVANMNLEGVGDMTKLSSLSELRKMQSSFKMMTTAIAEYRNYLPQSMLDQIQTSEDESVVSEANSRTRGIDTSSRNSASLTVTMSSASVTLASNSNINSSVKVNTNAHQVLKESNIRKKKCSFTYINVIDFHDFIENSEAGVESCISETHASIVSMVMRIASNCGGTPDIFNGDRLFCAFNAIRPCGSHAISASKTALTVKETLESEVHKLRISSGVVYGTVVSGNMGCQGMKKYSYIGRSVSLVHIIERLSRWNGVPIIANGYIMREATSKLMFKALLPLNLPKISSNPTNLFELIEERKVSQEEWMYALAEGERNDKWLRWNTVIKEVFHATPDWSLVAGELEHIMSLPNSKEVTQIIDAINRREPLIPETFRYI